MLSQSRWLLAQGLLAMGVRPFGIFFRQNSPFCDQLWQGVHNNRQTRTIKSWDSLWSRLFLTKYWSSPVRFWQLVTKCQIVLCHWFDATMQAFGKRILSSVGAFVKTSLVSEREPQNFATERVYGNLRRFIIVKNNHRKIFVIGQIIGSGQSIHLGPSNQS